ncbi:MAG: DUF3299 domain-containing protein [Pseudomonadota bacterium]
MNSRRLLLAGSMLAALLPVPAAMSADGSAGAAPAPSAMKTMIADATKGAPEVVDGYLKLGFDRLGSYKFVPPAYDPAVDPKAVPPTGEEQIPAEVKSWSGRKVMVTGFMMPVKMEKGLVTEFLLLKDPMMCCYGTVPNMNEWIVVKMKQGVAPLMDLPIAFYGELKIGAMFENGYMSGIYQLLGDKMGTVQN